MTGEPPATYQELQPGVFFTYRRSWPWRLFRRDAGLGQVVGVDEARGVLHVRVFWVPDEEDDAEGLDLVAIGHLPIHMSSFVRSAPRVVELRRHPVPDDCRPHVDAWERRSEAGEGAAFGLPLWEAVEAVLETVSAGPGPELGRVLVQSAYPKRDARGRWTVLEVAAVERPG